jgi:hypothetical protein
MKIAKGFLRELKVQLSSDSLGSIQTLYRELMDALGTYRTADGVILEHRSLSVWAEEFQVFLNSSDPRMIPNLTDLFDAPEYWSYSTLQRGLEDLSKCWLNILGAITPSLLQENLTRAMSGGGLISRMIFVVGYGKEKKIPVSYLSREEEELRDQLVMDLEMIKQLAGPFRPSERFIEEYSKWYMSNDANAGVSSDQFVGYNERRATHLRKLCMILSASQNDKMIITKEHFDRALYIMKHTEREMPNAFYGIGRGAHAEVLMDVLHHIKSHPAINHTQLADRFISDALPGDLATYIQLLCQTGKIKVEKSTSGNTHYTAVDTREKDSALPFLNQTIFKHLGG